MGLMSFIKEAGEKLLGRGEAKAAQDAAAAAPTPENIAALSAAAAQAIGEYIRANGLPTDGLDIQFEAATSTVVVSGQVADQAHRVADEELA